MSTVDCPRCRELVSIPFEASGEALVQCPLCQEEYRLDTVLEQLPPALVVIDDPQALVVTEEGDDGSAFFPLAGPDFEGDDAEDAAKDKSAPAFQFESGSANAATAAPRVRGGRPWRRSANPLRQVVQIVAGGVAGVIFAQLILWWAPLNLSVGNRDLTGFGRKYGRYIPFLVPSSIRGEADASGDEEDPGMELEPAGTQEVAAANVTDPDGEIPDFPFSESHLQRPGSVPDEGNTGGPGKPKPKKRGGRNTKDQPEEAPLTAEDEVATSAKDDLVSPDGKPDNEKPDSDVLGADMELDVPALDLASPLDDSKLDFPVPSVGIPDMEPTTPEEKPGLRNSPIVDGSDLLRRFSEALSANIALDTAEEPEQNEKRSLLVEFYQSFAGLGEVLSFVDRSDEAVTERIGDVDELLQEVGRQTDKLDFVGAVAPSWMDNSRPNDGVFLYGTVLSVGQQGPYHETRVRLKSRDQREVVIISLDDPPAHYAEGDLVVFLGTIVEEPTKRLGAYKGDATRVVLGGRHYKVQP